MKTVGVLFANGFEEVEGITQVDFLRRAKVEVITLGVEGTEIEGGHGIVVKTDKSVEEGRSIQFDGIVIPGGMPGAENVASSEAARSIITRCFKEGGVVGAICAAPAVVLVPTGILDGKRATCYPGFEKNFQDKNIEFTEERVVKDGTIITSRGPGTAAEFAVALIREFQGEAAAKSIHDKTLQK